MLKAIIEIGSAVFALFYTKEVRKPLTKMITVFLAISVLLQYDTLIGVGQYAIYLFAFVSLLAGAECFNSLNLKVKHRGFFVITSFLIVLVELEHLFKVPFKIESPIWALLYFITAAYFFFFERRKIKSRLAIIVLWGSYFLNWLAPWIDRLFEVI